MAEPFGISVGVIALVKDTCKVATAIYKTVESAREIDREGDDIIGKMTHEVHKFQSHYFLLDKMKGRYLGEGTLDEV